jgi:hypothetical protein
VKKRIEALIEREYLERSAENAQVYNVSYGSILALLWVYAVSLLLSACTNIFPSFFQYLA